MIKLKIKVSVQYPAEPPPAEGKWPTRNENDQYEQSIEIAEGSVKDRLEDIIKAFNGFE